MHELTIARNLIDIIADHASHRSAAGVSAIYLRLGELSGFRRALYFCFERVAKGTICEGAKLVVEEVSLAVHCDHCCEIKRPSGRYNFRCCDCGHPTPKVVEGREMQITAIELLLDKKDPCASASIKQEQKAITC